VIGAPPPAAAIAPLAGAALPALLMDVPAAPAARAAGCVLAMLDGVMETGFMALVPACAVIVLAIFCGVAAPMAEPAGVVAALLVSPITSAAPSLLQPMAANAVLVTANAPKPFSASRRGTRDSASSSALTFSNFLLDSSDISGSLDWQNAWRITACLRRL
jgi:hypothetical protein